MGRLLPKLGRVAWYGKAPGPARGPKPVRAIGEAPPCGFSEREEPRSFEARVCLRCGVSEHLWQGRTWTPDTTSAVRPRCPRHTGEHVTRDPVCATPRGLVQAVGRLPVVPLERGGPSCTRPDTRRASDPSRKKETCVHPAALCTREEHLHHSLNTHRRSLSGTPHAQHSDGCTVFHVGAHACGAGVSQNSHQPSRPPPLASCCVVLGWSELYSARHTTCSEPSRKKETHVYTLQHCVVHGRNTWTTATTHTGVPSFLLSLLSFFLRFSICSLFPLYLHCPFFFVFALLCFSFFCFSTFFNFFSLLFFHFPFFFSRFPFSAPFFLMFSLVFLFFFLFFLFFFHFPFFLMFPCRSIMASMLVRSRRMHQCQNNDDCVGNLCGSHGVC